MSSVALIDNEEELTQLLNKTENFEERKEIRNRLKQIRDIEKAEVEERRKQREGTGVTDCVKEKAKAAEEDKARRLKAINDSAKIQSKSSIDPVKAMHERSEQEKAAQLKQYNELAKVPGAGALQGGLERIKQMEQDYADKEKQRLLDQFSNLQTNMHCKAEEDEQIQTRKEKPAARTTASTSGISYGTKAACATARPKSALNAFKEMDKAANPGAATTKPNFLGSPSHGAKGGVTRNPSAIKNLLLEWCKSMTKGYEGVDIQNFSTSWNDGLAFCALIHHFHPEAFDFASLKAANRRHNFTLAFNTAEELGGVPQLLDVEDMMKMKNPDWKCVFTYVQGYYKQFKDHTCERHKARPAVHEDTSVDD